MEIRNYYYYYSQILLLHFTFTLYTLLFILPSLPCNMGFSLHSVNNLKLNKTKTKLIYFNAKSNLKLFSVKGKEEIQNTKNLISWCHFYENLNWKSHVLNLAGSLERAFIGHFRRDGENLLL